MSGQSSQRVRRIASPSTKQGPMKATLTFGLVQGSPTRAVNARKNSPSSSPTSIQWSAEGHRVKTRRSPDNRSSPERGSPCSPAFKVEHPKPVRLSPSSAIKRTGSLDTIAGPYLTGHWPRCEVSSAANSAQPQDKSTQTEGWDAIEGLGEKRKKISLHKRSSSLGSNDTITEGKVSMPPPEPKSAFKIIKSRLAKSKDGTRITNSAQRTSPVPGHHLSLVCSTQTFSSAQSKAVTIPVTHIPHKSRIRGSVEGPNQEIERALKSISGSDGEELQRQAAIGWLQTAEPTPDGHRAPVLELITRTIDTQTPSAYIEELRISDEPVREWASVKEDTNGGENQSGQSSRSQSESPDFGLIPGNLDTSRPSSRDETPPAEGCESPVVTKEATPGDLEKCLNAECQHESILKCVPSPRPNKSFSFGREPPDGCEKVKLVEESRTVPPVKEPLLYCPIQKSSQYHIPSVGSAFCPLYKSYMSHQITPQGVMANTSTEAQ